MKRVRINLKGLTCVDCPSCGAPCWLTPELGWVHRVPLCRWFASREPRKTKGPGDQPPSPPLP